MAQMKRHATGRRPGRAGRRRWLVVMGLLAAPAATARAQAGLGDSVTVVPGARYGRGAIHRLLFGNHYRKLWTAPIRVPRLDLARFAGGLTPLKKGGGQQTRSLRFAGADGRQYAFRSVDKDPSVVLPPDLRDTFADRLLQDQISAAHPVGALAVPPIVTAAGVLHAEPVLVLMPDDPALGAFREEFAGVLGLLEERPRDDDDDEVSFAGARKVVSTPDLFKELDDHPETAVDARAFLAARLTDVFLGDWDRHRDQWRWALLEEAGGARWHPIPRDRDQAFVRFDGIILGIVRATVPQLVNFGPKYAPIVGATWNGRDLDRRFLASLEMPVWDSVARELTAAFSDSVLDDAVQALPAEHRAIDGGRLRRALTARRDGLRDMARKYYLMLAEDVDVTASDRGDVAIVERQDAGALRVTLRPHGHTGAYFDRVLHAGETSEVRIYLHGGADSARMIGTGNAPVRVRFIGGGGDDVFENRASGPVRFYDDRGSNTAVGGGIDTRSYRAIDDPENPTALPHRDWGTRGQIYPVASVSPDVGLVAGLGHTTTRWGFRKKPYSSRIGVSAAVASTGGTGRLGVSARFQAENSSRYIDIQAAASGIEVVRWHGFGNDREISDSVPQSFYRASQHQVILSPSVGWGIGSRAGLEVGPRFKYVVTELDDGVNAARFIGIDRPYGSAGVAELGAGAEFRFDSRDVPAAARRGVLLEAGATVFPAILDTKAAFGEIHVRGATYLSPSMPLRPTLALQAGGKRVFGPSDRIPYFEAAFLGSSNTLRGFRSQRFAGDAAVYGTAELRLELARAFLFVPGRQGVFGFYDTGRVFLEGEDSNAWHDSLGGGIWLSFLTPGTLLSLAAGNSTEGTRIYLRAGFAF